MFDSHVHSSFSGDCEIRPETMINKAISVGAIGLSFADHLDLDYAVSDVDFMLDYEEYGKCIDIKKSEYKDKIIISKGIEVGIQPHVLEETGKIIQLLNPDFVVASIHCIDELELHNGDFCKGKDKNEAYTRYFEEAYNLLNKFSHFDIFGHFDIIRRYGDYSDKSLNVVKYIDIIDEILKKLIYAGKGIEINTSGFRYNLDSTSPDIDIIRRYKELGGEIITVGSDSHIEEHICYKFDYANYLLNKAGFKYYSYFLDRKPVYLKVSKE